MSASANREQIERLLSAFTSFLVVSSNSRRARIGHYPGGDGERIPRTRVEAAVTQAWTAVGVN